MSDIIDNIKKNCLSYWFPKIASAGLPVPKTEVIKTDVELRQLLDAREPEGYGEFLDLLVAAGDRVGWPMFLRTGLTSGKHRWKRSCYVSECEELSSHVFVLVEHSEMCGFLGLPYQVWAVREMLPTKVGCKMSAYGDMPLCREYRLFTKDCEVQCIHPYWPHDAVAKGVPDDVCWHAVLHGQHIMREGDQLVLIALAQKVAAACPGDDWSVDILETRRGWVITDMALAAESFHWDGCQKAGLFK